MAFSFISKGFGSPIPFDLMIWFWCLTPLSAIFQLYHGDQFKWWKKPEYPERTTDHGQATDKLYHLRLRVKCTLFLQFTKPGANPRRISDRFVWVVSHPGPSPLPDKVNRGIIPQQNKMVQSEIELDLPAMVTDLVYIFQMLCLKEFSNDLLRGTYWMEPNAGRTDIQTWVKLNALDV